MFFLASKLFKSGLYITRSFRHGQCFVWEFSVLAFVETAKINTNSLRNFSWSGNDKVLVFMLCMSSLWIKTLILDNIYIDRSLRVAFVKHILSQIYSHCIQSCNFRNFLAIAEAFCYMLCFFYPETSNFHNSEKVGPRKLPDLSMNIYHFIIYRLQYTLLIKRPDFGLKFLVTITPKVQSLKLKANVGMKQVNCSSLF